MPILFLLGLVVVLDRSGGSNTELAKKDLDAFQGQWKVVARELDGEKIEVKSEVVHTFRGNKWFTGDFENCHLKLDSACNPKLVDFLYPNPNSQETPWEGIYKIDGDVLVICMPVRPQQVKNRPIEFRAERGSNFRVYWFNRIQPKQPPDKKP